MKRRKRILHRLLRFDYPSILILTTIIVTVSSVSIHLIEPETFPTIFDGLWWTMTTLATVGYGDLSPKSVPGRILGMFLFVFGIGILGLLISKTVEYFTRYHQQKMEGKIVFKETNHYVYIGWGKKTKNAIEELFAAEPSAMVVLIDELERTPFDHPQVHYVQGELTDEKTFKNANILESKCVSIFSDSTIENSVLRDGKTLIISTSVESYGKENGKEVHTIVEIAKESHINEFKHVKVDDFVLSYESISRLMAKANLQPGTSSIFRQLLSKHNDGNNIHIIKPSAAWKTYKDAHSALFNQGITLLAINEDINYPQYPNNAFLSKDLLYVYGDEEKIKAL